MKKIILYQTILLTILMSIYTWFYIYIELMVMLFIGEKIIGVNAIAVTGGFLVGAIVPLLLGFLLVDRIKWWAVWLPIQFLIYTVILCVEFNCGLNGETILYVLFMLIAQSAGVIIRKLWQRRKRQKQ
ncbi:MAG: hypothetical protein ACI3YK_05875 [Eubacteriales bacterium]